MKNLKIADLQKVGFEIYSNKKCLTHFSELGFVVMNGKKLRLYKSNTIGSQGYYLSTSDPQKIITNQKVGPLFRFSNLNELSNSTKYFLNLLKK